MRTISCFLSVILFLLFILLAQATTYIDPMNKYAWGTYIGWLNLKPSLTDGVRVYADHLEGYIWAENIGWIRVGTHTSGDTHTYKNNTANNYGVNNDSGHLSGYAWSNHVGWINFNPRHSQVTINSAGDFDGYAWAENIGWIHFNHHDYKVSTRNEIINHDNLNTERLIFENRRIEQSGSIDFAIFKGNVQIINTQVEFNQAQIEVGATVTGGIFTGRVINQGEMQNIQLKTDAEITGGILGGFIKGLLDSNDKFPISEINHVELLPGTVLEHIILGDNIRYPQSGELTLGQGVKIKNIAQLPANIELKGLFMIDQINANGVVNQVLDLNQTLSRINDETFLQSVNKISSIVALGEKITQNKQSGLLELITKDDFYIDKVVSIRHLGHKEGIEYVTKNQHHSMIAYHFSYYLNTHQGLSMQVMAVVYQPDRLMSWLNLPKNNISQKDNGNIWINIQNGEKVILRPKRMMEKPDQADLAIGSHGYESNDYLFYQITQDKNGRRWQQTFYPAIADLQGLQAQATQVQLDEQGQLTFSFEGVNYQGILDYKIVKQSHFGKLRIKSITDTDNDGLDDFIINYPSGYQQRLFQR
jgi:hypothetical protein